MYNLLLSLDKKAAANIHMNNTKRVIRAIEMAKKGVLKSNINEKNDLWNKNDSPYCFITIYINVPREELYVRINNRVDIMVRDGIIEEAKKLKSMDLASDSTVMQAIGYKEFFDYLDQKETLEAAVDKLKQNTRRYAKRQVTWFKKLKWDLEFQSGNYDTIINELKRLLNEKKN